MTIDLSKSNAEIADSLATRVNLNGLSRVSPERFHAEKSEIAADLRRFAKRLRGDTGRGEPTTTWRPNERTGRKPR